MSDSFTIRLPKVKNRNPLQMHLQGKSQVMKDRRIKRPKDARAKRERMDEYGYTLVELLLTISMGGFLLLTIALVVALIRFLWTHS